MRDIRRTAQTFFLIAVLILSSGAFAPLWTDPVAPEQAVDGDRALQLVWASIYGVVGLMLLPHGKALWRLLVANQLLVLLIAAWERTARFFVALL